MTDPTRLIVAAIEEERRAIGEDSLRDAGWLDPAAAEDVEGDLNEARIKVERLRFEREQLRAERDALLLVAEAAKALARWEARRTDRTIDGSAWLEGHGEALRALLAAVDEWRTQTEAGDG
jgi:hypothetical protein